MGREMSARRGDRRLRLDRAEARRGLARRHTSWPAPTSTSRGPRRWREPRRAGRRQPHRSRCRDGRTPSRARTWTSWSSRPPTTRWRRSRRRRIDAGKHVLVEKPAGAQRRRGRAAASRRRAAAACACASASTIATTRRCRRRARSSSSGALGPLMFIRGRYGHGGRVGYDKEWRANPELSGGGELIDQGVHLIDLSRWFLGPFTSHRRVRRHLLLGHAGGRQRVPDAAHRRRAVRLPARQLQRVEEPVLVRDLRARRQAGDRRPRRQLRRRAHHLVPDAARDGPARDHELGVSARRPVVGDRVRRVRRGHPAAAASRTPAWPKRGPRSRWSRRSTAERLRSGLASTDSRLPTPDDDHHPQPASHHARRRRHRPAVLLPRPRRVPGGRGHRQVRLRHGDAALRAGHLPQVLAARARRAHRRGASTGSFARRCSELDFRTPQIEITTLADIPAGTGLGSSGSFTTALLKALYAHRKRLLHPSELAELACDIEINRLGEPVGKQDQYIAAYGGLTCFTFNPDGTRRGRAADDVRWTRSSTSRTTCCCSSPASRAAPAASSPIRRSEARRTTRR